jgi:hypothetical protein
MMSDTAGRRLAPMEEGQSLDRRRCGETLFRLLRHYSLLPPRRLLSLQMCILRSVGVFARKKVVRLKGSLSSSLAWRSVATDDRRQHGPIFSPFSRMFGE